MPTGDFPTMLTSEVKSLLGPPICRWETSNNLRDERVLKRIDEMEKRLERIENLLHKSDGEDA